MDDIGPYRLVRSLGKGGMGEVFLAHDAVCGRSVALKKIREDLAVHTSMQDRFLREARIASQLTHPSIIPIYSINQGQEGIYYTMPYVEGETLKEIIRTTREQDKKGEALHPIGCSIPSLTRIFLDVCQAIAYAHSRNVLHRDLKPENIIVGKFGEVMLLDWGLAEFLNEESQDSTEEIPVSDRTDLTRPGKIVGTITYMAPERALGERATMQTDIYALGVILYQLLTLRLPFLRKSIKEFRLQMKRERILDPTEAAPYRDIPKQLAEITKKCLAFSKEERYENMHALISDLQNYIEGRPEWKLSGQLDMHRKTDWAFQENVLLAKHVAITQGTEIMEWVSLMISKETFPGSMRLTTKVRIGAAGEGIGFLLCIPEANVKKGLEEGYCLWLGSSQNPGCKLLRSHLEMMALPELSLTPGKWQQVHIEKTDHHLRFFLDGALQMTYVSHTPLTGSHIGLLLRDADLDLKEISLSVASQNVTIGCLAVPDAFLSVKDYARALAEYRRIGHSFPGRAEGREALFRAGVTLLEEGLSRKKKKEKDKLLLLALEEFEKLRGTPGAPLEYLGKSLVYKAWNDVEEEMKCLELAARKYPKHPLLPILIDHISFRLHETAYNNRVAAYHFALLALRHLPKIFSTPDHQRLLESLKRHMPPLPFLETASLALQLAFLLAKPITLLEMVDEERENALFALLKLGCLKYVEEYHEKRDLFEIALQKNVKRALQEFFKLPEEKRDVRVLCHLFERGLAQGKSAEILPFFPQATKLPLEKDEKLQIEALQLTSLLLENRAKEAGEIFDTYSIESLQEEDLPLHFLFGCYLWMTEGREIAEMHLTKIYEEKEPDLLWEKILYFRRLALLAHCQGEESKAREYLKKSNNELHHVQALASSS